MPHDILQEEDVQKADPDLVSVHRVERKLKSFIESGLFTAAALTLRMHRARRTVIDYEAALGYFDVGQKQTMRPGHAMLTYSITKTFIAVLILKLVESHKLSLEERLDNYLPDVALGEKITIRQLLSHTSGLPDYGHVDEYKRAVREHPSKPWPREEFLRQAAEQGMQSVAGTSFLYSNIGYMLLVDTLEKVSQSSFQEQIANQVTRPLKLMNTFVASRIDDSIAQGWSRFLGGNGQQLVNNNYNPGWVAHRVIASTAPDLVHFIDSLFRGALLNRDTLQLMCDTVPVAMPHKWFNSPAYGLGLMASVPRSQSETGRDDLIVFGHTGSGPGYSAACYHAQAMDNTRVSASLLLNAEEPDLAEELMVEMLNSRQMVRDPDR